MNVEELKQEYQGKIDLFDLELIISRVIKKPREFIIAHPEFNIIKNYELKIKNYFKRRTAGEPLAYIFGEKEFYGLNFKVNKKVLVPRPETEMVVNHITWNMEHGTWNARQKIIFIDIGTGSGCIIITLAKLLSNYKLKIKNYELIGTDVSSSALVVARQNARLHKVGKKIKFLNGNLLEPIHKKSKIINQKSKIIITANLPYLTPAQIKNSPTIQHEPKLALTAGRDGLKYYRKLLKQIKLLVTSCELRVTAMLEIDPSQASEIKKIIKKNIPSADVKIKKDLKGHDRIVIIAA